MKDILKELRINNRYSQDLLSKILGISRQAYMKYESGEVEPSVEVVRKLSKIYKVSYKYLIDNGNSKSSEVQYRFNENCYNVAASAPSYSITTNDTVSSFYQNIQYLKQIINLMENQLEDRQKLLNPQAKSRIFNKDDFFKTVGEINMDSTYIDELRKDSLI